MLACDLTWRLSLVSFLSFLSSPRKKGLFTLRNQLTVISNPKLNELCWLLKWNICLSVCCLNGNEYQSRLKKWNCFIFSLFTEQQQKKKSMIYNLRTSFSSRLKENEIFTHSMNCRYRWLSIISHFRDSFSHLNFKGRNKCTFFSFKLNFLS